MTLQHINLAFQADTKFKYLGCADLTAHAMHKIPVGTVVTLSHDVLKNELDDFFECKLPESFPGNGTAQYFKRSELEIIG
ncbi:hypothetical protein PMW_37 [Pseudomonas phage phiPMW]|uniref:Uncharacterized protein n=1 Tax=Pseudomonas phage phiPMW TaxID=1815582 RepID=A0A1S5R170_9CAUD|nr:hypothetical protein FDG97_gp037 [Pseudomonas phage phiPMW]ANA49162.1 hypothetical protein PMW_37 [Pseudomonas phage phiPMW]